jgi:competence protein ComEC
MTRTSPFALITLAFATGIWLAAQYTPATWLSAVVLSVAVICAVLTRNNHEQVWTSALVALVALGSLLYCLTQPVNTTGIYNGRFVVLEGVIGEEPDARPNMTYLRVQVQRLLVGSSSEHPDGVVLVRTDNSVRWHYGDVLRTWGLLDAPPVLSEFDYRDYLARQGVFSQIAYPTRIQRIGDSQGSSLYAALLDVKDHLRKSSQQIMPAPESALLNGILIGDDNELPDSTKAAFKATGTSHIVAISGFNVSIVIAAIVPLLSRLLGKRRAAAVAIPAVIVYMLLTGASASVQRATYMAVIILFGQLIWRRGMTLNTLCAAAFTILLVDPKVLFDLGYQLSVLATLGLVLYSGNPRRWMNEHLVNKLPNAYEQELAGMICDAFIPTSAAIFLTTPLLLANGWQLSRIALLTNILVLPVQPAAMILGILACVVGLISRSVAPIAALPAYALLTYTLHVVESISAYCRAVCAFICYDNSMLGTQRGYGTPDAVACYAVITVLTMLGSQPRSVLLNILGFLKRNIRVEIALVSGVALITIALVFLYQRPDGKLHVTFGGAGAFIQTPSGKQVVFAGGGGVLPIMGRAMPLWDKDVELLIMPTRDDKARGDTLPLLQRYMVGTIIQPVAVDEPSAMLNEWQAHAKGVHVISVPIGTRAVVEPGVVLTIEQRADGYIGARLVYSETVFDLIGNTSAISGTLAGADVVFARVKQNEPEMLNAVRPLYIVWADAGGSPVRLDDGIKSFILRDVETVEFVSDGKDVSVR